MRVVDISPKSVEKNKFLISYYKIAFQNEIAINTNPSINHFLKTEIEHQKLKAKSQPQQGFIKKIEIEKKLS